MADNSDQLHTGYRQFLASINTPESRAPLDPKLKALLGHRVLAGPAEDEKPHELVGGAGVQKTVTRAPLNAEEDASLRRGLAQSAAGQAEDLGDFVQYID